MLNQAAVLSKPLPQPQYLWFLMLSFAMIVSISNWYDARLVSIFGYVISPGTLSYPLSFLISDCITEVYGFKKARLTMLTTALFNLLFILFGQLIIKLPSPSFATDNAAFDKLLSLNLWIICASFISYFIAEPINSFLIAKLKILFKGKYIGIRFILSTLMATLLDTVLFVSIAFYDTVSISNMSIMIFNVWLIKVLIELTFLPFLIRLTKWFKKKEEMDIYDLKTNFTLFELDSTYQNENNFYNKENTK